MSFLSISVGQLYFLLIPDVWEIISYLDGSDRIIFLCREGFHFVITGLVFLIDYRGTQCFNGGRLSGGIFYSRNHLRQYMSRAVRDCMQHEVCNENGSDK